LLTRLKVKRDQTAPSILALSLINNSVETVRNALRRFDGGWKLSCRRPEQGEAGV
jgi:hypothetical protein